MKALSPAGREDIQGGGGPGGGGGGSTPGRLSCHEGGHHLLRRKLGDPPELVPDGGLLRAEIVVSGPGRLEQREAPEPAGVSRRKCQAGRPTARVAHEVETVETGLVRTPQDPGDLDVERVVPRGSVAPIELELFGDEMSLGAKLF